MRTFEDLKKLCEKSDKFSELNDDELNKYRKEIKVAERFYSNGRNLYEELINKKSSLKTQYIIPYLLGLTDKLTDEKPVYVQVKPGASGAIDVDSDISPSGREKVFEYLRNKYGDERVLHVGTFSTLGPASAAKDVLRANKVDFTKSNKFTKSLEKMETWEENLERLKATDRENWNFYLTHKDILDDVPYLIGKERQQGKHAGGVVITDKPIYNYIPVDRVKGEIVTSYPESGGKSTLDDIGIIKYDLLGISILDVITETIEMIDEKIYEIEDDDGIRKIVPSSYIDKKIEEY